jgi:arginine decarboxylase-like protein
VTERRKKDVIEWSDYSDEFERAEKAEAKNELLQQMWELKYSGTCSKMLGIYEECMTLLGQTFDAYKHGSHLSSREIERVCNALNNYTKIRTEVFKKESK